MKTIKVKSDSIPKLTKKAQDVFNRWIRRRDADKGCISCGAEIDHAGHYLSAGHHGHLRFNEMNVNGQCLRCNNFLHGNLINYRIGLVKRYGEEKVQYLESCAHGVKKWTRIELLSIIAYYKNH
jgi:hypothetical protein